MPKRRVGIVGSLVWDEIHGRDPARGPVEEWGGIAYAMAAFDAALGNDWELIPLIKVGRDLAGPAEEFLRSLARVPRASRFIEVPTPNNRVVLRYSSTERRCERMAGGVPGWTWGELGPLIRDLDALYVNFISGFEMCLGTASALRSGFRGPLYADLHSLLLQMRTDGLRTLGPLPDAPSWYRCFDYVQVNEDEMGELSPEPLTLASAMLAEGVRALIVTLGAGGAIYVEAADAGGPAARSGAPIRTAKVPAEAVDAIDPTGCGDVFGATTFARLLDGAPVEAAVRAANRAAGRNATYRGASGLNHHLRGSLLSV